MLTATPTCNAVQATLPSAWGSPVCAPSSGACVSNSSYMSALSLLSCSGCALQGSLPSISLPALTQISLPNNNLSGSVPLLVAPLLQAIVLDNNTLEGTLPGDMAQQLRSLQVLSLAGNKFRGPLPEGELPSKHWKSVNSSSCLTIVRLPSALL